MTFPLNYALPAFSMEVNHYLRMRAKNAPRDRIMETIRQVRRGHMRQLFPDELNLSLSFDGVPIANFVDIVAHDMAEGIAPLPALACTSGKMITDVDLARAEKKNRIGDYYWVHSRLEKEMLKGADRYITYGFLPFFIEPDVDEQCPVMILDDPMNAYYEKDRFGDVTFYAKRWLRSIDDLCASYPELANLIRRDKDGRESPGNMEVELVRWVDDTNVTLFLPMRDGLILNRYAHLMEDPPVVIAERAGLDDDPRGQFDDVIWVQVARAIMSTLALEAASTAVQAPIAVPDDLDEFPVGANALYQSDKAGEIHRVNLDLSPNIFAESERLDQELKTGSRYPDARTGNSNASVITGKGVEALLGTYDTQIKGAQMTFKQTLQDSTAKMFEMDEKWWPDVTKTVSGTLSGKSYELTYTPSKDIAQRWKCTVTYGFAAGMHPSQSIVTMLQLEGAGLIAHSTLQMNIPVDIDPEQEQRLIDVENTREALKQGLFALVQAAGPMAAQGQDPTLPIDLAADVVKARQNGQTLEDAVKTAIATYQQKQADAMQQQQQAQQAQAAQAPPGAPGGLGASAGAGGLPPGVAPGQAEMPPGGKPTVQNLIAGFRGNANLPINSSTVQRRVPTGGP